MNTPQTSNFDAVSCEEALRKAVEALPVEAIGLVAVRSVSASN